jgi:hypothetical protein
LLERIVKQVYGNGQKGLASTVPELSTKIETLIDTTGLLSTNVSAMMRFQSELKGIEIHKEKDGFSRRQQAGLYISVIIGMASILTALIIKFA